MPVTIQLVDHPATAWQKARVATPEELLKNVSPRDFGNSHRVVQSSFARSNLETKFVSGSRNGFIWAAYHAYSAHHHLLIRPEDIWFAILTQMSFFVNANAEELRSFFVDHEGKKDLEAISNVRDFGALAIQMTSLIAKNVKDPELREWVMPSFSTTTVEDKVVGAVLFMGAMQKYFSYGFRIACGLPSVTLLGDVEDWKEILRRLDRIDLLGEEPRTFACMLRPILHHMVLSFENPTSLDISSFWNSMVQRTHRGSGTDELSGWLTAFCFWSEDGRAQRLGRNTLFEVVKYPIVKIDAVPAGFASVPVRVDDNGVLYQATMIAGSVGVAALSSNTPTSSGARPQETPDASLNSQNTGSSAIVRDTVRPISGWWVYKDKESIENNQNEPVAEYNGPEQLRDKRFSSRKATETIASDKTHQRGQLSELKAA